MANFIGLVYATLKEKGIDTSGMSTDEAVAKFKELQGEGKEEKKETPEDVKKKLGEKKEEAKEEEPSEIKDKLNGKETKKEKIELSETDKEIIDDAIYWASKKGNPSVRTVFEQLDEDMKGYRSDAYKDQAIDEYVREKLGMENEKESDISFKIEDKDIKGNDTLNSLANRYMKQKYPDVKISTDNYFNTIYEVGGKKYKIAKDATFHNLKFAEV